MATAWGRGLATIADDGTVLDTWFREVGLGEEPMPETFEAYTTGERHDEVRRVHIKAVQLTIDTDDKPASASDAYLRLHLLSHRLMKPREQNLDGLFGQLTNVAWTNLGPAPVEGIEELRWRVRRDGGDSTGRDFPQGGQDRFVAVQPCRLACAQPRRSASQPSGAAPRGTPARSARHAPGSCG